MIKSIIASTFLVGLTACASLPTPVKDSTENVVYKHCLASANMIDIRRACFGGASKEFDEVQRQGAQKHWDDFYTSLDVDRQLMAGVISRRVDLAQGAIASGANVNRVFSSTEVSGRGNGHQTALMKAGLQLDIDMFELLLKHGADPAWLEGEQYSDVVVNVIGRGSVRQYADGTRKIVSGLQIAELAYQHGYRPNGRALEAIEAASNAKVNEEMGQANLKPFLSKLMASASPETINQYSAIKARRASAQFAQLEEDLKRKEVAKLKEKQRLHRMRATGARVCMDKTTPYGAVTYIGFVENLAPEKAQIRVSSAHFRDAPSLSPGGFSSTIIWDNLHSWRLCE